MTPGDTPTNLSEIDQSLPDALPGEPFSLFRAWFDQAQSLRQQPNPNAMTLATVGADGSPSARIVLCKDIDPDAGTITFHTNYNGRKGRELETHPAAAVVFHWDHLDRQVRIEGPVTRAPDHVSESYFRTRPWTRQVGAWASDQSEPIDSRSALIEKLGAALLRFGINPFDMPPESTSLDIPRPPHWGGYYLWARSVELWLGSKNRLHDRARWTRELRHSRSDAGERYEQVMPWTSTRLQP